MSEHAPRFVVCPGCGRDVPNGSIYCPYCCSESGRQSALLRAALKGALFGAFVGCLLAVAWTLAIGLDRATWGCTAQGAQAQASASMAIEYARQAELILDQLDPLRDDVAQRRVQRVIDKHAPHRTLRILNR